jgi:hypothetical protein
MGFEMTKVDVWVGEIEDRPGALATKLEAVMRAGADLDFMIARPLADRPGTGVLFIAPLYGAEQFRAAEDVGLKKSSIQVLRIEGPDRPGLGAGVARTLAEARINIRGLSGAALGDRCLFYVRFDSNDDVVQAAQILTQILG